MWIQVRSIDGMTKIKLDGLSKLTKIEDVQERLVEDFEAPVDRQRLFYRGKQLVAGHTLFDYNVGLNDLIQIMVKPVFTPIQPTEEDAASVQDGDAEKGEPDENKENQEMKCNGVEDSNEEKMDMESVSEEDFTTVKEPLYKVGTVIDCREADTGAWFEAEILKIKKRSGPRIKENASKGDSTLNNNLFGSQIDDGFDYSVRFDENDDGEPTIVKSENLRPRARNYVKFADIKVGQTLMANFNYDEPKRLGYWYDCLITNKEKRSLTATVYMGCDLVPVPDCQLKFVSEIFQIEEPDKQTTEINAEDIQKRKTKPDCDHCYDDARKKCKHCACCVCGDKAQPDKQILCDECNQAYHLWCVRPALDNVPEEDEWYCPDCKNDDSVIVKAGEKLKESKKKSKMVSATSTSTRDWGKGMACVGRTKVCTIVPPNHFGPIPGVEVGTQWKFRVQASEAGVHRPHVAGIHGREDDGSYSLVLSGGYEDDHDDGDEFTYTGSGGRDLSGNKRTAEQSCDQMLTRNNRALAKNCNAKVDNRGAEAKNWKAGKPVRVIRNCKGAKHSSYAPTEGNRYDGIYKIVKYWPEKGKSGFLVWRYMLRRDDTTPPPWTKAGKKRIKQLGLEMQYPDGYEANNSQDGENESNSPKAKKGKKRKNDDSDISSTPKSKKKSKKSVLFDIDDDVQKWIKEDDVNRKLWGEVTSLVAEGAQKFLSEVAETFMCICCQEAVYQPVTTDCGHNICKLCLSRSFKAEVYSCPACRAELGKNFTMNINKNLSKILHRLFPGYEAGR